MYVLDGELTLVTDTGEQVLRKGAWRRAFRPARRTATI